MDCLSDDLFCSQCCSMYKGIEHLSLRRECTKKCNEKMQDKGNQFCLINN